MGRTVVLLALLVGCGGDGPADILDPGSGQSPSARALIGNWIAQLTSICGVGLNFAADGSYSQNNVCVDSSSQFGADLETTVGSYTADSDKIYFSADKSTCSDQGKKTYLPYTLGPGSLTVTTDTTAIVLKPNTASGGVGAAATLGCFRNGAFTPAPLVPI